mgnify:CR=1 FL=1
MKYAIIVAITALAALGQQPLVMNTKAPAFTGGPWLNTAGGAAPAPAKVTIVHFWTYGCYNCLNNLPVYARWQQRFAGRDVAMVGVHTPEFDHEARVDNVQAQIRRLEVRFPVLVDSGRRNWDRWNQQFWPAVYLVDAQGRIRYRWDGELNWRGTRGEEIMAQRIEQLLAEER